MDIQGISLWIDNTFSLVFLLCFWLVFFVKWTFLNTGVLLKQYENRFYGRTSWLYRPFYLIGQTAVTLFMLLLTMVPVIVVFD